MRKQSPPQWSVSRILFRLRSLAPSRAPRTSAVTTIPLRPALLTGSSDLPGSGGRAVRCCRSTRADRPRASLFGLAPCGVLPATSLTAGAVRSYRTFSPLPRRSPRPKSRAKAGGTFSVPLSFELPRPGVTRRTALWSSDFPPAFALRPWGSALRRGRLVSPKHESSKGRVRRRTVICPTAADGSILTRERVPGQASVSWLMAYCSSFL